MKEIDFLPDWYKSGRRREVRYRTQYIALSAIFVIMMLWNFATSRSITKSAADLALAKSQTAKIESASLEFAEIQDRLALLQKQALLLEKADSKIDVASVLAELSFHVGQKIVLNSVEFIAEKFSERKGTRAGTFSAPTAIGNFSNIGMYRHPGIGDVKFKVVIKGIASDASEVAELICRLEDSPYFENIYPSFSRNKQLKTQLSTSKGASFNAQVSEFEMSCYLANYSEKIKG